MTVCFGNHTKLIRHIKDYENHRLLKKYTENYPEVPAQDQYSFSVVKRTEPMYIRTVDDQGLQYGANNIYKNGTANVQNPANDYNFDQMLKAFYIDLKKVKEVNSTF